jgi:uncharacterized membrane protein YraQ (UPF0718 family)
VTVPPAQAAHDERPDRRPLAATGGERPRRGYASGKADYLSRLRKIEGQVRAASSSSSCSYAAVALARSLFRQGASFTAAMAFEIASTNLVVELGIILALLMGWQFTLAEFTGGPIMIILLALLFRLFLRQRLLDAARAQAGKGLAGSMEGHAAMDMTIQSQGSLWQRLRTRQAFTSVSHIFVMEWAAVTVLSLLSFVCTIGNVPLAAVLWNGGISFAVSSRSSSPT